MNTIDLTVPINKIPQFRFIGSKHSVLSNILEVIKKKEIYGEVFFDVFSGSTSVSRYFKRSYSIRSNDMLYFSYVLQRALIVLNDYPNFRSIDLPLASLEPNERIINILHYLNNIKNEEGFIFSHYTPESLKIDGIERKYFSTENGNRIDSIRTKIYEWFNDSEITEDEYFYLLASLLMAVQKVSNISGTYGAYNKFWDTRSAKPLRLNFIDIVSSEFRHQAFNKNTFDLLNDVECDIAYIDPPYNERQYIANYHILETIARYDNPEITGKTGIRKYGTEEKSTFCSISSASNSLAKLLRGLKTKYVVLSYNSDGLLPKDEIIGIFEESDLKKITVTAFPYRRFKSNSKSHSSELMEYIFTGEVK
jgi:adenine-specific DNA-methyltransferase